MPEALHILYPKLFLSDSWGHALWKNISAETLKPGFVGYFDDYGNWQYVGKIESLSISEPGNPVLRSDGIVSSRNAGVWVNIEAEADASAAGVPAGAKTRFAFHDNNEQAGFCRPENVVRDQEVTNSNLIHEWIRENAYDLISKWHKAIDEHGLWIVTKTHITTKAAIAVKQSDQRSSFFELAGKGPRTSLGLEGAKFSANMSSSSAIHYQGRGRSLVLFMEGRRYKRLRIWNSEIGLTERKLEDPNLSKPGRWYHQQGAPGPRPTQQSGSDPSVESSPPSSGKIDYGKTSTTYRFPSKDGRLVFEAEYEVWGADGDFSPYVAPASATSMTGNLEEQQNLEQQHSSFAQQQGSLSAYSQQPLDSLSQAPQNLFDLAEQRYGQQQQAQPQIQQAQTSSSAATSSPWTWSEAHRDYYYAIRNENGNLEYIWAKSMKA